MCFGRPKLIWKEIWYQSKKISKIFFVAHMWHNIWPAKWKSRIFAKFWWFENFSLCAWCVHINMRKCWQKILQHIYFTWQYGYVLILWDNLWPGLWILKSAIFDVFPIWLGFPIWFFLIFSSKNSRCFWGAKNMI